MRFREECWFESGLGHHFTFRSRSPLPAKALKLDGSSRFLSSGAPAIRDPGGKLELVFLGHAISVDGGRDIVTGLAASALPIKHI